MKRLALLSILAISFTSCGSSDGQAATATEGDQFCKLAATAKADSETLSNVDQSDADAVKLQLSAEIDSLTAAVAKAPKDIVDTMKKLLANFEKLDDLLKDNDYDIEKMSATEDGKALLEDDSFETTGDEADAYLSDKCGIATDDSVATDDTIATEDTIVTEDTILTDDTLASGGSIDLGEGEEAINAFLDYYEVGTGATLTNDERSCIVDALADKVTGDELNEAIAGNASDDLSQTLGLAFIGCNVTVGG